MALASGSHIFTPHYLQYNTFSNLASGQKKREEKTPLLITAIALAIELIKNKSLHQLSLKIVTKRSRFSFKAFINTKPIKSERKRHVHERTTVYLLIIWEADFGRTAAYHPIFMICCGNHSTFTEPLLFRGHPATW